MNVFTKQRLNASIIVLLIVLNLLLLATIWFQQGGRKPHDGAQERGSVENFLVQELSLTQEQAQQVEVLREKHFQDSRTMNDEMRPLKEAIVQEVFSTSPDSAKVKTLAEEVGSKQAGLEELRFQHFLALRELLQPEQRTKFQDLFHEFFPPQPPPAENRPQLPGAGPEQGRTFGPKPPKEAIESCLGKNQGSACQFTAPHGEIAGVCRVLESQLACVPKDAGRKRAPAAP